MNSNHMPYILTDIPVAFGEAPCSMTEVCLVMLYIATPADGHVQWNFDAPDIGGAT